MRFADDEGDAEDVVGNAALMTGEGGTPPARGGQNPAIFVQKKPNGFLLNVKAEAGNVYIIYMIYIHVYINDCS